MQGFKLPRRHDDTKLFISLITFVSSCLRGKLQQALCRLTATVDRVAVIGLCFGCGSATAGSGRDRNRLFTEASAKKVSVSSVALLTESRPLVLFF